TAGTTPRVIRATVAPNEPVHSPVTSWASPSTMRTWKLASPLETGWNPWAASNLWTSSTLARRVASRLSAATWPSDASAYSTSTVAPRPSNPDVSARPSVGAEAQPASHRQTVASMHAITFAFMTLPLSLQYSAQAGRRPGDGSAAACPPCMAPDGSETRKRHGAGAILRPAPSLDIPVYWSRVRPPADPGPVRADGSPAHLRTGRDGTEAVPMGSTVPQAHAGFFAGRGKILNSYDRMAKDPAPAAVETGSCGAGQ